KLGLPVVDGVGAAVKLAESLVGLGLGTSRVGGYARPLPKGRVWGRPPVG
ncbi:MAG: Asp/Glu/hydantoin racemase, partial [Streptomyces sp.]|nr:Asp/Glu/hydantoin racemase [Streptomyces sp.]